MTAGMRRGVAGYVCCFRTYPLPSLRAAITIVVFVVELIVDAWAGLDCVVEFGLPRPLVEINPMLLDYAHLQNQK